MTTIYNTIGAGYNSGRRADPYLSGRLLDFLESTPGKSILDIGCGTGNYAIALAQHDLHVTGVDPSPEMLNEARSCDPGITWLQGSAEKIPTGDRRFDGVIGMLTIHHWSDITKSMLEISRVMKPGGTLVLFTATPQQMKCYWLNHYFPQMMQESANQMPGFYALATALANAGLELSHTEKYYIKEDLQDHFLYSGKHNPGIYLDAGMRKGISSFSALANADEVEKGLLKLSADIESGHFETVKDEYENNKGDYLFVVAGKF